MIKLPKSVIKFFLYFIKQQPFSFFLLSLAPLSIVLETNIIPYSLKIFIDTIVKYQGNKNNIINEILPALYIGGSAWLGLIIIIRLQHWFQTYIIPTFEASIRESVLSFAMLHSYQYFSNNLAGDLANKISDLPRAIESIRGILYWNIIAVFAVLLVALIMMSTINLVFCWILIAWVIIHITISLYFVRFVNKKSKANAEDKSILNGTIVDIISNINTVKLFARNSYEMKYFNKKQSIEKTSNASLISTINIFQLAMDIPVTIMLGITFYFLIIYWQEEKISTGDFVFIFNMMFAVINQMWHLGKALAELFRDIGVVQQALNIIICQHQIIDRPNSKPINVTKGIIIFKNVSFSYNKDSCFFKNKNVKINGGEKVGIVGLSGSGKTTFINLILRFFDLNSGVITIDGQDITNVTQDSLRENIAMIPQDAYLFHRTLLENIRYGNINATDKEVIKAAQIANCHEFITKLPNGYNSLVGERGLNLSGGQRQRIAIARALLKDAPILIFDESTSALDSITEKYIQDNLLQIMHGRTTIVIAHRLSTLSKMDRILVFEKGNIIEDGTHNELMKANGQYVALSQ